MHDDYYLFWEMILAAFRAPGAGDRYRKGYLDGIAPPKRRKTV
jgi:hypothetical protein